MSQQILCSAIQSQNLVQFNYSSASSTGVRVVEPHMVAYNPKGNLALSAWFLAGASGSQEGEGWREYLLAQMSDVTMLPTQFSGARPGYRPDGGKTFHSVQCGL